VARSVAPNPPPSTTGASDSVETAGNTTGNTSVEFDNIKSGNNHDKSEQSPQDCSLLPSPHLGGPEHVISSPASALTHLSLTVAELRNCVAAAVTEEQLRFYQIFAAAK